MLPAGCICSECTAKISYRLYQTIAGASSRIAFRQRIPPVGPSFIQAGNTVGNHPQARRMQYENGNFEVAAISNKAAFMDFTSKPRLCYQANVEP